jgi:hypothetical protein
MIYGKAQVEKWVYGEHLLIQDLPDGTEQEFRFRKNDLQTVSHSSWPKAINLEMVTGTYDRICLRNQNYVHFETGLILFLYWMMYPSRISPEMDNEPAGITSKTDCCITQFTSPTVAHKLCSATF